MEYNGNIKGIITSIGHGTMRDGPGWRSIVYFKGCNFRCGWCSSPETWPFAPDLLLYPAMEKYPDRAADSCPHGAISPGPDGTVTSRALCADCEDKPCADECLDGSREVMGQVVSVDEVISEIEPYRRFHRDYGVTLSGGEVTCQWMFFIELLKGLKARGLHTAAETNASMPMLPDALPWLDLVICDLKHPDPVRHAELTGYPLEAVMKNIRTIAGMRHPMWIRIPLIPVINDGKYVNEAATLLAPYRDDLKVEILGFHQLGAHKWDALGKEYIFAGLPSATEQEIEQARAVFREHGFDVIQT
jgi:glycyl-radical enzyme activating protein